MKWRELEARQREINTMTLAELAQHRANLAAFQAQCLHRARIGLAVAMAGILSALVAILIGAVAR